MKNRSILLLAALLLPAAGCSSKTSGKPDVPAGTPVILISIDTLRADRLPAYGYKGVETPALDAFRDDAILYERAYTVTPLTLPAHSSLLTGVLPALHTVRDNVGYRLDAERIRKGELPFLPQILKNRGYATGGAVSAYVLQGKTGLSTGFDFYEDSIEFRTSTGLGGLQRPGGETLRLSMDWLRGAADKPFFYFFHIYEPHTPYAPPEPFASKYADKYDGEIAASDAIVGELIDELKRLEVYDKALIVLLSDHGEGLNDHGEDEHGVLLYHEAIHVPLLLKLPESQLAGSKVPQPVQLLDVAPTVLSLLGEKVPESQKGLSLVDMLGPQAPVRRIYAETFYPRLHFGWSELSSLIDGEHHYIEGPDPELYDMTRDPRQKTNILQQERRTYAAFRKEIEGYDRVLSPPAAVDQETREAMAALGYVGSGAGSSEGPLPDPKSRIASLGDLKAGVQLLGSDNYPEAAEAFRRVIAQNPKMVDAWEFLGRALQRQGRIEEALAAYREALEISGGSPHIAVAAASLYFDLEQLDEAEKHARLAVAMNPSFAHGLLSQIALRRDQLDLAEKEARLAVEGEESLRVGPMVTLAEVLHARKDFQGALELTRKAEEAWNEREGKDEDLLRGLYVVRGKVLADMGDAPAAEAAFRREIELFPDSLRAYSSLALLYALTGRGDQAGPTLRAMVDANPNPLAYAEAVKALRVMNDPASAASLLRVALRQYPDSTVLQGLSRAG